MVTGNTFQSTIPRFPHEGNSADGFEIQVTTTEEPTRIDEVNATLTYLGFAKLGANENDPVWKIKRVEESGNVTSVTYANGNRLHDNIWTNRASLNYL